MFRIQREMMVVMSHVATPSAIREQKTNRLDESIVVWCEEQIDRMTGEMGESTCFILPGGDKVSAHLQLARAVARRAERRLWTLHRVDELPVLILQFVNRLSEFLFTMARYEMSRKGDPEEVWKDFLYKRRK